MSEWKPSGVRDAVQPLAPDPASTRAAAAAAADAAVTLSALPPCLVRRRRPIDAAAAAAPRLNIRGEEQELLTKTTHWIRSNRQRDAQEEGNRVYKGRGEPDAGSIREPSSERRCVSRQSPTVSAASFNCLSSLSAALQVLIRFRDRVPRDS